MSITIVTGTGTGIGKTVTTAALVALAQSAGVDVATVKPVQTGAFDGAPGDMDDVERLTGCPDVYELQRLPDPLAPETAARMRGLPLLSIGSLAARIDEIAAEHSRVVVEGCGGVLVRLDKGTGTVIDLADALQRGGRRVDWVVVTELALGTLNDTELTVAALRRRGHEPAGLVVGRRDRVEGLAERCNLVDLPSHTGLPLLGCMPAGAGGLDRPRFAEMAAASLSASLA